MLRITYTDCLFSNFIASLVNDLLLIMLKNLKGEKV